MSNSLAVATVTATFAQIVAQAVQSVPKLSAAPEVRTGKPVGGETQFVGANIYLYRVSQNASLRNQDLATRNESGELIQRPQAAVDLDYLLTFYGNDQQLEPQRLMGATIAAIHAQPILTSAKIREAIDNAVQADPDSFLADSDLDRQAEYIRFSPVTLSLEDLSKLWTVFFQVTHALSIAYQCSVVLLESDLSANGAKAVQGLGINTSPSSTGLTSQS